MPAVQNWPRVAAVIAFACALALAGCADKKDDAPKAEGGPKEKKKDGDITMDDLRAAAKAAGGDLDAKKPVPPPVPSLAKEKPVASFTVEEWLRETEGQDYGKAFYMSYLDKIVDLTGTIAYVSSNYIGLKADRGLPLTLGTMYPEPWKKAFPGQTVRLRAHLAGPGIRGWEIIEAQGPLPDKFTAEELARAVAKDAKGMEQKFKDKYVIVSGTVEKVDVNEGGYVSVKLKTADGLKPIEFGFATTSDAERKRVRPNMKLTVLGQYDGGSLGGRCEIMELTP